MSTLHFYMTSGCVFSLILNVFFINLCCTTTFSVRVATYVALYFRDAHFRPPHILLEQTWLYRTTSPLSSVGIFFFFSNDCVYKHMVPTVSVTRVSSDLVQKTPISCSQKKKRKVYNFLQHGTRLYIVIPFCSVGGTKGRGRETCVANKATCPRVMFIVCRSDVTLP